MAWKRVCKVTDVPENTLKKFTLDDVTFVIANYGGGFRAIPPLCPHMAEPLEISGVCDGNVLTCTKHLWQWDMRTGGTMGMAERELLMYPVAKKGDSIEVNLEKELTYNYDD